MYQRLVAYKKQYNSTNVPWKHQEDPKQANWVHHQRDVYMNKTICLDRISQRESTGFVWDPYDEQWMKMYSKLVAYKRNSTSQPKCQGLYGDTNSRLPIYIIITFFH
jgi:hypothetical protein